MYKNYFLTITFAFLVVSGAASDTISNSSVDIDKIKDKIKKIVDLNLPLEESLALVSEYAPKREYVAKENFTNRDGHITGRLKEGLIVGSAVGLYWIMHPVIAAFRAIHREAMYHNRSKNGITFEIKDKDLASFSKEK